jgi:translation initiation factor IF-2
VPLSARTGDGVDKLLEIILLVAELNELKGDPQASTHGVVIESNLDKFKGPIATLLVRNGTLKKGDQILLGGVKGKIRGMFDYTGKAIDQALPSTPVEILGLDQVPAVGATLGEEAKSAEARAVSSLVDKLRQEKDATLKVVIKADKQGSLEAVEEALYKFNEEREVIKIVGSGTGDINDADIKLAAATGAIMIGFNSKVVNSAQRLVESEKVLVRTYNIIYELIDEIRDVVEGMLTVGALEEIYGTAQIIAEFPYGKNDRIAGCRVLDGTFTKGPKVRIIHNDESLGDTKIKSLKKVREEVNRVEKGDECGMMFEPDLDFTVGDVIQSYRTL